MPPDEYEIVYADLAAFNAALDGFGDDVAAYLTALVTRMENPQHRRSRSKDYKKLKGPLAERVKLHELRGKGHRLYFGYRRGGTTLIIAGVGRKGSQSQDIPNASKALEQWDKQEQARLLPDRPDGHRAGVRQRSGPRRRR